MISTQDLYKEIEIMEKVIEKEKDVFKKAELKSRVLTLKLLHNLRTNMVLVMKFFKVPTVKSKRQGDEKIEEKRD